MESAKKYYNNEELFLKISELKKQFPDFFDFESIGKSSLGEDIWLITMTDKRTLKSGISDSDKPAFWIDANIHASEVTGTQGCIYFCEKLLNLDSVKRDPILKKITYYILPRFSPDGAAAYFKEKNSFRSTPLQPPFRYNESYFNRKDMDGDGEITLMRWKDPSGAFKTLKGQSDILIPRDPSDFYDQTQDFYHVLPEGEFKNFDGFNLKKAYDFGYDFNRQSPSFYAPEGIQKGAGERPLQFQETRAVAEEFSKRKNIFAALCYHTYGGFIIKTPANLSESQIPMEDRFIIQKMGDMLSESTQYSLHAGNDDFIYVPGQPLPGTFDEWYYLQNGVLGLTVEYWDLWKEADLTWKKAVEKYETISESNMEKLLSWCSRNLEKDQYFKNWTEFKHPQLGTVEIGGFKTSEFLVNPPVKFLEKELEKVYQGSLQLSLMAPNLDLKSKKMTAISEHENIYQLDLVIRNSGYLPTYSTEQALKVKAIDLHPKIQFKSESVTVISAPEESSVKHLKGFSDGHPRISPFFGTAFNHEHEQKLTWLLKGKGSVVIAIDYQKGGKIIVELQV